VGILRAARSPPLRSPERQQQQRALCWLCGGSRWEHACSMEWASMQRCSGGAAMQQCGDAAMQRCSPPWSSLVLPGQPQASARPVVIRREARLAPVNFWSGRFSCGALASIGYIMPQHATVPTCQRANVPTTPARLHASRAGEVRRYMARIGGTTHARPLDGCNLWSCSTTPPESWTPAGPSERKVLSES
jgi:hypothetical protein